MASGSGQGSSAAVGGAAKEYRVRAPPIGPKKTFCITKFNNVDLKSCGPAKIERENNLKEYKLSHDMDLMPKFGAGSEFGREQREEARRKKYGVRVKKYNPADQPYVLKLGSGKQAKRYKGSREGGIQENASYYIFQQCPDGAFQFMPVSEWYKFTPISKYKCLNSEEAEEEFDRRDRTLNYFSIMVRKRMKNDEDAAAEADAEDGAKKGNSSKKKSKDFMLTELDEWANMTDGSDDDSAASGDEDKPKKKPKGGKKKSSKHKKMNSDDEALEESDDTNEGQEVDYMTDSDSADDAMYDDKVRGDSNSKYEEKGVEDEDGLRTLVASDEDEEEEEKDEDNEDEDKDLEEGKKEGSDSESSSGSDSDSDPEKDSNFASPLFMQSKDSTKRKSKSSSQPNLSTNDGSTAASSRSSTPSNLDQSKGKKRKAEPEGQVAKKPKPEPTTAPVTSSDNIMQEAVKRYLMRKPMTTTDLIQKFKSKKTGLDKDQLVTTIAQILKQLNPQRSKTKDKLFLFIPKTDK
ncbi:hypothetical protein NP493_177g00019 [Ridgeia piscesae]|uniref:Transcription initiation factor IIF subunit alpha n=1 Tax=Ridgeia piscesae TaxID=27915 RepID=A0AAD9P385_RIDPI|nr:hypothetical protein NP493_177g00019 [Ridgeia piscesae]